MRRLINFKIFYTDMKKRINLFKAMAEGYTINWKSPLKTRLPNEIRWHSAYKVKNNNINPKDLELLYKLFGRKKDAE